MVRRVMRPALKAEPEQVEAASAIFSAVFLAGAAEVPWRKKRKLALTWNTGSTLIFGKLYAEP